MMTSTHKISVTILAGITLLGFLSYSFTFEKEKPQDLIKWSKDNKLVWKNFQGRPVKNGNYKAMTFTKIKAFPVSYSEDSIVYRIDNFFNKKESWKLDSLTESLLKHEQLHFDISELIARKTRKAYSMFELRKLNGDYIEISKTFKYFTVHVKDSINDLYDKETKHGINTEQQKKWEKYVQSELDKYEEYSSTIVTIK